MTTIEGLQEAVAGVAERVGPSVVGIGHHWARGSGVVIAPGRVLTNAHNLRGEAVTVTFTDGRSEQGRPAGVDLDGDLAVIEVDTAEAPALSLNGASRPSIGKAVLALSNPGGLGLRVTFGLVSGTERSFRGPRGRRITGTLEHTAPLLPGSSGGPVVDPDGHLLGINTNRLGEGFYLAIPSGDALRERVDALGRGEAPRRRRLGVAIASGQVARGLRRAVGLPEVDGLLVRGVEEDGPAARAGLEEGDLLVAVGERELHTFDDLAEALESSTGTIELRVLRGTEERAVSVDLNHG
jgi:serine protease Do